MKIFVVLLGAWFAMGLVTLAVSICRVILMTLKLSSNGRAAFVEELKNPDTETDGDHYNPISVAGIVLLWLLMWPHTIPVAAKGFDDWYEKCKDL